MRPRALVVRSQSPIPDSSRVTNEIAFEQVVAALELALGDRVADLGSGGGDGLATRHEFLERQGFQIFVVRPDTRASEPAN